MSKEITQKREQERQYDFDKFVDAGVLFVLKLVLIGEYIRKLERKMKPIFSLLVSTHLSFIKLVDNQNLVHI